MRVDDAHGNAIADAQLPPNRTWLADEEDGKMLAFGSTGAPAVWQEGRQGVTSPSDAGSGPTLYARLQPGGDLVVTRSDVLRLWSAKRGRVILSLPATPAIGETAGFSADGRIFFTDLTGEGVTLTLRLPRGQELTELAHRQLAN